jgi:hypothetical protein
MNGSKANASLWTALVLTLCTSANAMAGGLFVPAFSPGDFSTPLTITNPYWPMPVSTAYVYFTKTADGCEWDEVDVTNTTRHIDGVDTRIVLDRVWLDTSENCAAKLDTYDPDTFPNGYGDLTETTQDYHAQDNDGNVWYLGEHTIDTTIAPADCETYADGSDTIFPGISGCLDGSFIAGANDALPGIVMMAEPLKGDFYQQEFDEDNAEDWGKVLNFVPVEYAGGDYENCLETKEWSPLEHGAIEHKYYCQEADGGRGALVQVEAVSGGKTEWTKLIDVHAVVH